ncbi:MAG: hypothetical protein Q9188_001735 [Gyalolechia gomerana]
MSSAKKAGFPLKFVAILTLSVLLSLHFLLQASSTPRGYLTSNSDPVFSGRLLKKSAVESAVPAGIGECSQGINSDLPHVPHVRRAEDFKAYVCKGAKLLDMILHGPPLKHPWGPEDLENCWRTQPKVTPQVSDDLEPILAETGDTSFYNGYPSIISVPRPTFHGLEWVCQHAPNQKNLPTTQKSIPNNTTTISEPNSSPRFRQPLPPLWRWLVRHHLATLDQRSGRQKPKTLKHDVFRDNTVTEPTRQILELIVQAPQDGFESLPWPGTDI